MFATATIETKWKPNNLNLNIGLYCEEIESLQFTNHIFIETLKQIKRHIHIHFNNNKEREREKKNHLINEHQRTKLKKIHAVLLVSGNISGFPYF